MEQGVPLGVADLGCVLFVVGAVGALYARPQLGDPDITMLLPIRVVLQVDGITVWDFTIEGDPSTVCRGPTGCSADAPSEVDPAWLAPDQRPLLVAYDRDGAVIAVYAPYGMP